VETALAGIPGLRVHAVVLSEWFLADHRCVPRRRRHLVRTQRRSNERLGERRSEALPPDGGTCRRWEPISTGLGEIYMWTVEFDPAESARAQVRDGEPGWQRDGSYLTPEGESLRTDLERAAYLRTVQDWLIRPQLRGVEGVAGVDAIGGYVKQYHVEPDPMQLVSYGLTFADVVDALEGNNVSTGAGYVEHHGESYLVRAAGRIESREEIAEIVVGSRSGTPIYVRDVAQVHVGRELRTGSASENGEEVVVGTALMLIGANSRTVSQAVDERMTEVNRTLPPGIRARTVLNRTKLVNATIDTVTKNLAEGAALVIIVLLVFLGNLRAALICALAIPLSMLMTAIGMVQTHISGNLMSLGAIDFGLIVDGAVIIVENSLRKLAERQHALGRVLTLDERLREVAIAAKEMVQPSVYGQAIIVTVYIPLLALTGVPGKMFHPMSMTVIFALAAAFVLSLTFVPAMVAILVTGKVKESESFLVRAAKVIYAPALRIAVRARVIVVLLAVAAFAGSLVVAGKLGQEFIPTLDEKDIAMHAMRIPSTSLTQSTEMQFEVERAVSQFPEVAFVFSKTGTAEMASDPMPPNVSDTFIIFKPKEEWPNPNETKDALRARLETAVEAVPGNNYEWTQPIQMRFNELLAGVRGDVAVKVYGDDFDKIRVSAEKIADVLRKIDGAADVKVEQTEGLPVMSVRIDRQAIARYGLKMVDVQDVIAAAVGGRESGQVFEGDRRFDLVVRLPEDMRRDLDALRNLPIPIEHEEEEAIVSDGSDVSVGFGDMTAATAVAFVPLSSLAEVDVAEGPNQVSRENGKRRIVVQCNVRGRDLGSFVTAAQAEVKAVDLPPGGWLEWGGQFENLVAARERLSVVVPVCFLLIFFLLYSTFGSTRYALLVFSGVPLGLTGGILALWLRDMPFSISAGVGLIALSGVAVLNGLVMVSCINQLRGDGMALEEAIKKGALLRLRPVLMTALVASLGFVPMALATGTGAEVQKPLATVVIGGLISSTFLTLVVLPALYRMFSGRSKVPTPAPTPAASAS
jgi:cobalt-zinc-cadmium resistance protein CzcA